VLPAITAQVQELLTEADGFGLRVRGLGIAISRDVDRAGGVVRFSPFLEWRDVPFAELAGTTTGLPVNDSGDHIHPNDAGVKAMADAIDLRLLRT
jgi:predicted NBD/HSP70 family sugar kinase